MEGADHQEIDLTLGLSTNGRFGVNPNRKRPRDTSETLPEPNFAPRFGGLLANGESSRAGGASSSLLPARVHSLPGETDEWRRRMGVQLPPPSSGLVCMHESCRQRRLQRCMWLVNNHGGLDVRSSGNGNVFWNGGFAHPSTQGPIGAPRIVGLPGNNNGLYHRQMGVPSSQGFIGSRSAGLAGSFGLYHQQMQVPPSQGFIGSRSAGLPGSYGPYRQHMQVPSSQGPIFRPQTTGSTGNYGLYRQGMEGGNRNAATALQLQRMQEATAQRPTVRVLEGGNEVYRNALLGMPLVSTRVQGPYARNVDGFLYEFNTWETIKIVCVCHGYFLTPAEFVRHGGGGDVENPLRHIVVRRSNLP